mmetsp:Transcript_41746/g.37168  ORF Transcript_41746/g.37168 Transcript_41746/m.37168 type:complete len:81 (-) Transcript_41746:300-542(-)
MGEGDNFGEIALTLNTFRTATVAAKENCHFLILGSGAYRNILGEFQAKITKDMMDMVRRIPIARNWPDIHVSAVMRSLKL